MNTPTDSILAKRASTGDQLAFGELVRRHQSLLFNIAYRLLGNQRDAEDAAQEAFVRSYKAIDTFNPDLPILPWLKRITINVCINHMKRNQKPISLDSLTAQPREPNPGPETQTVNLERNEQIRAAILSLPSRYRVVIELRHFQNYSYAEISKTLNCPLSDVKSDLFRARRILAKKLKDLRSI